VRFFSSVVILLLAAPALVVAQRPPTAHRWAPLVVTQGDRIDLDTAVVELINPLRRVWIRWVFDLGVAGSSVDYQLEQREVDCALGQTRVLAAEYFSVNEAGFSTHAPSTPSPSDMAWHRPAAGSLNAMVVSAVCQWRPGNIRQRPGNTRQHG